MRASVAWRCRCQSYVDLQNLRQPCVVDGRGSHPGCCFAVVCELWGLLALVRGAVLALTMHQCLSVQRLPAFFRRERCLSSAVRISRRPHQPCLYTNGAVRLSEAHTCAQLPRRALSTAARSNSTLIHTADSQQRGQEVLIQRGLVSVPLITPFTFDILTSCHEDKPQQYKPCRSLAHACWR